MKYNFKIKLVAFVAAFSGAAGASLGNCYGIQAALGGNDSPNHGIIQASEASYSGAFGTVKPATHFATADTSESEFPPIVAASQADSRSSADPETTMPPILKLKTFPPSMDEPATIQPTASPAIIQSNSALERTTPPIVQSHVPIVRPAPAIVQAIPTSDQSTPPITRPGDQQFDLNPVSASGSQLAESGSQHLDTNNPLPMNRPMDAHSQTPLPINMNHGRQQNALLPMAMGSSNLPLPMNSQMPPDQPLPVAMNQGWVGDGSGQPAPPNMSLGFQTSPSHGPSHAPNDDLTPEDESYTQVQPQQYSSQKKSVMLSPIGSTSDEFMSTDGLMGPEETTPVVQATGSPGQFDASQDVHQAAQWGQSNLSRGVSAAGVPLYPTGAAPQNGMPQIVDRVQSAPEMNFPPVVDREIPPAPSIGPNSRMVSPIESLAAPAPIPLNSRPAGSTNQGSFIQAKTSPVTPTYRARQDYFDPQPMEAPVMAAPSSGTASSGCQSCGGSGCPDCGIAGSLSTPTSSCQSCGPDGCFDPNSVCNQFGDCGSFSNARRYLVAEGLYLTRRDGIISNSNFGSLSNFDWAGGLRLTLGNRQDSIRGREITYFGTDEITEGNTNFDAAGRIRARFVAGDGFLSSEISAFRNAVQQNEFKQTEFHSLEFNRVEWGWDVVKNFIGLRYIYNEDSYTMSSQNLSGESGLFEVYAKNNLIGPNFGTEIYYDVGRRLSATFVARGGLYGSINQVRTKLNNDGTQVLDVEDNNSTIGGSLELGINGRFKLGRRSHFRFGYNYMVLERIAEAANNVPTVITPSIGADTSDTRQMQFHGANIGFEIYR